MARRELTWKQRWNSRQTEFMIKIWLFEVLFAAVFSWSVEAREVFLAFIMVMVFGITLIPAIGATRDWYTGDYAN